MTFKTLSKRQNGTVDPSLFSLHLIEGKGIPDWKKFISSGENIIRFLGDYIAKHIRQNSSLQEGQSFYLAGLFSNPETVKMLNQNGMLDCSCLVSTQEEADTRIILHALYSDCIRSHCCEIPRYGRSCPFSTLFSKYEKHK